MSRESRTVYCMLENMESGSYVIPNFHREFVWTEGQIADLFESLYRGIHIGELVLWKIYDEELMHNCNFSHIIRDINSKSKEISNKYNTTKKK